MRGSIGSRVDDLAGIGEFPLRFADQGRGIRGALAAVVRQVRCDGCLDRRLRRCIAVRAERDIANQGVTHRACNCWRDDQLSGAWLVEDAVGIVVESEHRTRDVAVLVADVLWR